MLSDNGYKIPSHAFFTETYIKGGGGGGGGVGVGGVGGGGGGGGVVAVLISVFKCWWNTCL